MLDSLDSSSSSHSLHLVLSDRLIRLVTRRNVGWWPLHKRWRLVVWDLSVGHYLTEVEYGCMWRQGAAKNVKFYVITRPPKKLQHFINVLFPFFRKKKLQLFFQLFITAYQDVRPPPNFTSLCGGLHYLRVSFSRFAAKCICFSL